MECRSKFWQGMLAAYVELRRAFILVHREALWELLRLRGIPAGIISLLSGLYPETECCKVWRRHVQLLPCEYRSEARLCLGPITFQHLNGLDFIWQSC